MEKLKKIIILTIMTNIVSLVLGIILFALFFEKYMIETWLSVIGICVITVIIWIIKAYKILTK